MAGKHNCSWQEIESLKPSIEAKIRAQDITEGTSNAAPKRNFRKTGKASNQNQKRGETDDTR